MKPNTQRAETEIIQAAPRSENKPRLSNGILPHPTAPSAKLDPEPVIASKPVLPTKAKMVYVDVGMSPYPDLIVEILSEPVLRVLQEKGFTRLRVYTGQHYHVYKLLKTKVEKMPGLNMRIHSDEGTYCESPASVCLFAADLVITHTGRALKSALRHQRPTLVVGYDGSFTAGQLIALMRMYIGSSLGVEKLGNLAEGLRDLDINSLATARIDLRPEVTDILGSELADITLPKRQDFDIARRLCPSLWGDSQSNASFTDIDMEDIQPKRTDLVPATPDDRVAHWLVSVQTKSLSPLRISHLNRAIPNDRERDIIFALVAEAHRSFPGFPHDLPRSLVKYREAILKDLQEGGKLPSWVDQEARKRKEFKMRIQEDVKIFRHTGMFPLRRFLNQSPQQPPIEPGRTQKSTARLAPTDSSTAKLIRSSFSPVGDIHVPVLLSVTPSPMLQTNTAIPTASTIHPTQKDLSCLYSITSTFPLTEISIIPVVYERLSRQKWKFSDSTAPAIATFLKKHLPFYRTTPDDLIIFDPSELRQRCSPTGDLAPLPEYTQDAVVDRVMSMTSALSPTDKLVKKAWRIAYGEFLCQREIGGCRYNSFSELQKARGVMPLSEVERDEYLEDFIEHVVEKVEMKWNGVDEGRIISEFVQGGNNGV